MTTKREDAAIARAEKIMGAQPGTLPVTDEAQAAEDAQYIAAKAAEFRAAKAVARKARGTTPGSRTRAAKTGNPQADRKANGARAAKAPAGNGKPAAAATAPAKTAAKAKDAAARRASLDKAAAARLAAIPEARREAITGHLAKLPGYQVVWPKASWTTLRLADPEAAGDGAPAWMILCNAHGTAKAITGSTAAVAEGKRDRMPAWCAGCKKAAGK
jgi:hypothetical protein